MENKQVCVCVGERDGEGEDKAKEGARKGRKGKALVRVEGVVE